MTGVESGSRSSAGKKERGRWRRKVADRWGQRVSGWEEWGPSVSENEKGRREGARDWAVWPGCRAACAPWPTGRGRGGILGRGGGEKKGEERGWALGPENREEGLSSLFSFPFFYSKTIFKSILKITLKYF